MPVLGQIFQGARNSGRPLIPDQSCTTISEDYILYKFVYKRGALPRQFHAVFFAVTIRKSVICLDTEWSLNDRFTALLNFSVASVIWDEMQAVVANAHSYRSYDVKTTGMVIFLSFNG